MIRDVEVRDAGSKGRGVYALRDFGPGEFIFRRRHARIVTLEELDALSDDDRMHLCELDWTTFAILRPPGAYLNHSCDPNAMRSGVKVFAWRPIRADDEIVIDYRLNATGGERWACECGSKSCLGYVEAGGFFAMDDSRQREYLPYAPPFIRAEYRRLAREAR